MAKRINVAAGKTVNTPADFAKVFNDLNVDQKTATIKNLDKAIDTGLSPSGIKLSDKDRRSTEQLRSWCLMNLFVGDELAPPESLKLY